MTLNELLSENERRKRLLAAPVDDFNPDTPQPLDESFQYWAAKCVKIRDKRTGRDVPFLLNRPQKRVLKVLEEQRLAGKPIRLILLKARQWGGSTLVQLYMAWIQCVHRTGWHSLICAHLKNTASTIRGMYTKVLDNYPEELWAEDGAPSFKPFERSQITRVIPSRGCCVTIGSAENQEGARGLDISMAHLSEVAFWRDTTGKSGAEFAQAICSGIPLEPYTFIAMESTARGVGNFFHEQWLKATDGKSNYAPVFVPWYEIDIYAKAVADPMALWESMSEYERELWELLGLTLEQINWYHQKLAEMPSHLAMKNEYPSTAEEAFASTTFTVFAPEAVAKLRASCVAPAEVGEIVGKSVKGRDALKEVDMKQDSCGKLQVWSRPVDKPLRNQYVVAVDVGGRTDKADYSVIAVFERHINGPTGIVAQWRGHIDHDLLAWKAAAIARFYGNALLVVESNTLESETAGDGDFLLDDLGNAYTNLYYRSTCDPRGVITERRPGFHTNRSTKALVINSLISHVRDGTYIETSADACNELTVYESTPQGTYAARRGCHDDILMTRAIGLYVISRLPPLVPANYSALSRLPGW